MVMIYGIIILVAIIVIILLSKYLKNKYLKLTERDFSEYEEEKRKIQEEYRLEKEKYDIEIKQLQQNYNSSIAAQERSLNTIRNQIDEARLDALKQQDILSQHTENLKNAYEIRLRDYKNHRITLVDEQLQRHKVEAITKLQSTLRAEEEKVQASKDQMAKNINEYGEEIKAVINDDILLLCAQKESLQSEVNDFKEKQRLINEAILRKRAVEEQSQFYKIQLSDGAKEDIQILLSIMPRLHDTTSLYKLIYDLYIARPVKEMEKRVLNNESFSGIYKITGPDERIYIGKSTDIKSRWQQHCKSAFHTGTISWAAIHDAMEKQGIDNFTFEVIERVEKENLSAREKFWIEFYEADKYGFNMKAGG